MKKGRNFLSLDEVIEYLQKQVIKSDKEFNYLQAKGWNEFPQYADDFNRQIGFEKEILKGFEKDRFLSIKEISFTIRLIRKETSIIERFKQAFRYLLGNDIPLKIEEFVFLPSQKLENSNHISVEIKFKRNDDGSFNSSVSK